MIKQYQREQQKLPILCKAMEKKWILKDMYEGTTTIVSMQAGATKDFPKTKGLHQDSTLSPYQFYLSLGCTYRARSIGQDPEN